MDDAGKNRNLKKGPTFYREDSLKSLVKKVGLLLGL